jgi:hypothetical protein
MQFYSIVAHIDEERKAYLAAILSQCGSSQRQKRRSNFAAVLSQYGI